VSWMSVKKGAKVGRMEGEAGGWGCSEFMPMEVSIVGRGAEECWILLGLSGGSLLGGGKGDNNGGILDKWLLGCVMIERRRDLQKFDFLSPLSPRDMHLEYLKLTKSNRIRALR